MRSRGDWRCRAVLAAAPFESRHSSSTIGGVIPCTVGVGGTSQGIFAQVDRSASQPHCSSIHHESWREISMNSSSYERMGDFLGDFAGVAAIAMLAAMVIVHVLLATSVMNDIGELAKLKRGPRF